VIAIFIIKAWPVTPQIWYLWGDQVTYSMHPRPARQKSNRNCAGGKIYSSLGSRGSFSEEADNQRRTQYSPGAGREETDRKLHEALVHPGGDRPIFTRWCRIVRTSLGSVITAITFRDEWKCGHSRANDPESVRGSFLNCDRRLSASLPPHRVASGIVPSNAQQNPKQGCSGFCCVLGAGISM
jgi:hypothetical protein